MEDVCESFTTLRCLSPEFDKELFQDENFDTKSSLKQKEVEKNVGNCIEEIRNTIDINPEAPTLDRHKHVLFLKKSLYLLPSSMESSFDSSRPWLCYWMLHALEILDEPLSQDKKDSFISFLTFCQHPDGGFSGAPGYEAHLAPTFAAVNTLCILRTQEAYDVIDREKLLRFLLRLKMPDGSFKLHDDSESDIRGVYCALSVAKLTNILCPELIEGAASFAARCQTYEGGFGGVPGMEAHGAYSFCGFASLVLMGQEQSININSFLRWLVHRQMKYEGGFQGRANKLVDSCYSFWQGGIFPLIHRHLIKTESDVMNSGNWLFNQEALQEYILINCQAPRGGLIDKPGQRRDYYHTCYALSGLSVAQHFAGGQIGKVKVVGHQDNEVCPIHPVFNLGIQSAIEALEYFKTMPVPKLQ